MLINKKSFTNLLGNPGKSIAIGATDKLNNFFLVRTSDNKYILRFEGQLDYEKIKPFQYSLFELAIMKKPYMSLCFILKNDNYLEPFFISICNDILKKVLLISQESDEKKALLFQKVVSDWNSFFKKKKILDQAEQIGLIGELLFIKSISELSNPSTAIKSWTSNHKQDFSYNGKAYEVKTSTVTQNSKIRINGIDQLDNSQNDIILVFIQIDKSNSNNTESFTLSSLIDSTIESFEGNYELKEIFFDKLISEKRVIDHKKYIHEHYIQLKEVKYFKVTDEFPKISPPLNKGILNLRYDILISECDNFLLDFNDIKTYWKHQL